MTGARPDETLDQIANRSPYRMHISWLTVDKLGVKLYDRASAVIAELVANSYDADATTVRVEAPMNRQLATTTAGVVSDAGFSISIFDDGCGMTPEQMQEFYLMVGSERRDDPKRGARSQKFERKVMGRKGVGKLAPFGICESIEILSAGGDLVTPSDGASPGYRTAHLRLLRSEILENKQEAYVPEALFRDGTLSPATGTTLTLTRFSPRFVPTIVELGRQLAQRFGIEAPRWTVTLIDNLKDPEDSEYSKVVGRFDDDIKILEETVLKFDGNEVKDSNGSIEENISSLFSVDDRIYPIRGWMGFSKEPFKDDLMAGVRIYCNGKIAAQTAVFNRRAGFTGEHDIRSYLVGRIDADWLDEYEDLIQTDRRDILWSHEIGSAFETWGQKTVVRIGRIARTPLKIISWNTFQDRANLAQRLEEEFPSVEQASIRHRARTLAETMSRTMRRGELDDDDTVEAVMDLVVTLAPHLELDRQLEEAASSQDSPLSAIGEILRTARIAELSSYGRIADERVRIIDQLATKIREDDEELAYQKLIAGAQWLVNHDWVPIVANKGFATLKDGLVDHIRRKTGQVLDLGDFADPLKRADFVLINAERTVEIVEIKKPGHTFVAEDFTRMNRYYRMMRDFLTAPANRELAELYPDFHLTLVSDYVKLDGDQATAYEALESQKTLTPITWSVFLDRARHAHQQYLDEADRLRLIKPRGRIRSLPDLNHPSLSEGSSPPPPPTRPARRSQSGGQRRRARK